MKTDKPLPTGFINLDADLGGIGRDACTVIAGSTGMGKSLLATQILINLAKNGNSSFILI